MRLRRRSTGRRCANSRPSTPPTSTPFRTLPDSVGQVLLVLRQSLRYEDLELVADAALAHRPDAPAVRRLYAQALVDGGNPAVALRLYSELAADETVPTGDRVEARGGIGRCYKEMFLACTEPDRRRRFLSRSLEAYLAAYLEDTNITPGTGSTPLPCWPAPPRRHRAPVGITEGGRHWPSDILRTVDAAPVPDTWTEVTACEAAIALGRYDEAVERAEAFIETTPEGFTVAAFLRQLQKVWQLDTTTSPATSCSPCCAPRCSRPTGARSRWRPPTSAPHASPTIRRRTARGDPRRRPIPVAELVPHGAEALPGGGPHPDGR